MDADDVSTGPTGDPAGLLLEARGLTKRFGSVQALDGVSLAVRRGEIVALLGENGAGKSTLVKTLFGLVRPDEGVIRLGGDDVVLRSPRDAIARGVGMVHQHVKLVGVMTVAENVVLGAEPRRRRVLDRRGANAEVTDLAARHGLGVDPTAVVEDLPVGMQQRVEILRALYHRADLLILDEPTAVLTPSETDELLRIMRSLAAEGTGIVFITHKLAEVRAVADRVTVLRAGKVVGEAQPAEVDEAGLASMMVGRSVVLEVAKGPAEPGEVVLGVRGLEVDDDRHNRAVRGVDLEVRAGEIVGVAGVQGNGQRELAEAICGMRPVVAGSVTVGGRDVTGLGVRAVRDAGVAHIPEDRGKHGLVGSRPVADELVLNCFAQRPFARRGLRDAGAVRAHAEALVAQFDVRTPSVGESSAGLSGGNQQKLVVARELSRGASLVVAAQPTRGIDVGAIEFIHGRLVAERDRGAAVLLVSAELDEVLALSDRVAVMRGGVVVAVLPIGEATRERVGLLMAGGAEQRNRERDDTTR